MSSDRLSVSLLYEAAKVVLPDLPVRPQQEKTLE